MEDTTRFDLNVALQRWLARLSQSPHFRSENLNELESHVRDSIVLLQSKGLSADEAFLIGTRRVGSAADLEGEFAKENGGKGWRCWFRRNWNLYLNRLIHLFVLVYFTTGCFFVWGVLKVGQMGVIPNARLRPSVPAPAFTRLCFGLMQYWYVPPILALLYCGFVWTRKAGVRRSWIGFFAITTAVLLLLALPALIGAALPIIDFLNRLPKSSLQ